MIEKYITPATSVESLYKSKGSKFISILSPVENDEGIKLALNQAKRTHPLASHYCYAYRLSAEGHNYKSSDDGEPAGTAGKPILNQILSWEITNCILIIVRYFGGTKLGVAGLITAYKKSALEVINASVLVEKIVSQTYLLHFHFEDEKLVNRIIKDVCGKIIKKNFIDHCFFQVLIPISSSNLFCERIGKLHKVKMEIRQNCE